MRYAQLCPPPDLASVLHCIWQFEGEKAGAPDRIVPDGRCELIVHAGTAFFERDAAGAWRAQPRALFAGQLTRPLHVCGRGDARVIGLRFHHAAARDFFGAPLHAATDRRLDFSSEGCPVTSDIDALLGFVRDRIRTRAQPRDVMVEGCVARIVQSEGAVPVPVLESLARLGRRQLERRFADAIGVGPALFGSIIRFRRVFDEIDHAGTRPWTDASLAAGYSDQSHFIREFRRFVGCTPGEFQRSAGALAAALVE